MLLEIRCRFSRVPLKRHASQFYPTALTRARAGDRTAPPSPDSSWPDAAFGEASPSRHQRQGVHKLRRISDLDGQLLAERPERGFDLIEPGVVRQIEKPVHVYFGDSHAARHFCLTYARGIERHVDRKSVV